LPAIRSVYLSIAEAYSSYVRETLYWYYNNILVIFLLHDARIISLRVTPRPDTNSNCSVSFKDIQSVTSGITNDDEEIRSTIAIDSSSRRG